MRGAVRACAVVVMLLGGCGEPTPSLVDAGQDAGALVPDGGAAVDAGPPDASWEVTDAGPSDAGLDCGPHGEAHFDHCHCHAGYVEEGGRCVPIDECAGDDPLEPDDRFRDAVPWEGSPWERWLCPGDRDHATVTLAAGDELTVLASFEHDEVDVDLAIWIPGADPRFDDSAARSTGTDDEERLIYRARHDGAHLVRIHSFDEGAQGAYRLELVVEAGE
ncbi:MAG TPA: hypothetical protein RMH99_21450 [Sandaracinaceae bacterium LLY-WYZ-13_1]|nr:hypothetical protein [Sandaracinaceae bacterium LLY-WYZ-13_1]